MLDGNYELPDHCSDDLKDLFIKFFQVKPQKRITIAELWQHPWICAPTDSPDSPVGAGSATPGIISEMAETAAVATGGGGVSALQREDLNDRVIIQMVRMGFDNRNDQIATAILDNKCDKVTATYHLLIKKQEQLALTMAKKSKRGAERRNSGSGRKKHLTPLGRGEPRRSSRGSGADRSNVDSRETLSRQGSRGSVEPRRRSSSTSTASSSVPRELTSSLDGGGRKSAENSRPPSRSLASLDGKRLCSSACRPMHHNRFTDPPPPSPLLLPFRFSIVVLTPMCHLLERFALSIPTACFYFNP